MATIIWQMLASIPERRPQMTEGSHACAASFSSQVTVLVQAWQPSSPDPQRSVLWLRWLQQTVMSFPAQTPSGMHGSVSLRVNPVKCCALAVVASSAALMLRRFVISICVGVW